MEITFCGIYFYLLLQEKRKSDYATNRILDLNTSDIFCINMYKLCGHKKCSSSIDI